MKKIAIISFTLYIFAFAQDELTDPRDNQQYKAVKIGSQTWMAENMNHGAGVSTCYGNNNAYCKKYGRLYDWNTAKSVCPNGWHLPTKEEWKLLDKEVGGASSAGRVLKSKSGWNSNGNGTDEYGFSALPGGYGFPDGSFRGAGYNGGWWSASKYSDYGAHCRGMDYSSEEAAWGYNPKSLLYSVRCVRD